MDAAWRTCLELAAEGKSFEPSAKSLRKAAVWQQELRRQQKAKDDAKAAPDTSHARMERVAMYCERNPLGHYEGNGGLFEFVPILVNVVSVRMVSNRATTAPRRRCLPCAALRGAAVPRRQGRRQAAPQPALHRQPVLQLLLRAAPLRRHPARLLHAAVARAVLPCAAPLEPTPPHHADAPPSGRHRTHSRHRLRLAAGRPAGGGQGAAAGLLRVGRAAETTELCGAPLLKTHVWPLPHDAPRVAGHQPGTRRFSIVLNHH